jgi:hypothetical protein
MVEPEAPYRVVIEKLVTGAHHYSAAGPGIGYSKPWFDSESEAETLCRVLAQAFNAGKKKRSLELQQLLDDDGTP